MKGIEIKDGKIYINGKREKIYIIETPEMTDNDTVGIGVPDIVVAKKSDKTKNIVLENGRYTGKIQAEYSVPPGSGNCIAAKCSAPG